MAVGDDAKKYLIAEFLRFVHPFNYFLMPIMIGKNARAVWARLNGRKDAAEYLPLLDFVRNKFAEIYGETYEEFLDLIMVDRKNFSPKPLNFSSELIFSCSRISDENKMWPLLQNIFIRSRPEELRKIYGIDEGIEGLFLRNSRGRRCRRD